MKKGLSYASQKPLNSLSDKDLSVQLLSVGIIGYQAFFVNSDRKMILGVILGNTSSWFSTSS
jgi:hypothetical protein